MALGAGAPAFADDVDNAPAKSDKPLAESNTVSRTTVTKPGDIVDIDAAVGEVGDVAEKLNTKNDLASKTNALGAGGARALQGTPMMGGLPLGG